MSDSIHTARWLSQINDQGWDLHLYPSMDMGVVHPEIHHVKIHPSHYARNQTPNQNDKKNIKRYLMSAYNVFNRFRHDYFPVDRVIELNKIIQKIKPDIIHTLETQAAGYLLSEVKQNHPKPFPPWVHTIWGSDLFLFGRLEEHKEKISKVLQQCDYFLCECKRDIELAKNFGFNGKILPRLNGAGGLDLSECKKVSDLCRTSDRKLIMLKGYQSFAGRSLVGLRALERCADALKGYQIILYVANQDVKIAAELFSDSTGIPVQIIPHGTPHLEMLKYHSKSRLSIGLSISDGLPNSLFEAMAMGSFPIQSWTACTDEWIIDGENGLLVPPEDPEIIETAIRKALSDDELVNQAADINEKIVAEKLDHKLLKPKAVEIYKTIAEDNRANFKTMKNRHTGEGRCPEKN